jgi:hypothetical protein
MEMIATIQFRILCLPVSYIVLPAVLFWCGTWSFTVNEEHRLRVFWHRVLRIFGHKRENIRRRMEEVAS